MRSAPAFQISLRRFAIWRAAVLVLFLLGISVVAAWLAGRDGPLGWALIAAAASALAVSTVLARALWQTPPADLRWDGLCWHLARAGNEAASGGVTVAIDLGPWMLLRFTPMPGAGAHPIVWLPVQRLGSEAHWHALRCAVHSPQSSARAASDSAPEA